MTSVCRGEVSFERELEQRETEDQREGEGMEKREREKGTSPDRGWAWGWVHEPSRVTLARGNRRKKKRGSRERRREEVRERKEVKEGERGRKVAASIIELEHEFRGKTSSLLTFLSLSSSCILSQQHQNHFFTTSHPELSCSLIHSLVTFVHYFPSVSLLNPFSQLGPLLLDAFPRNKLSKQVDCNASSY